MFNRRGFLKAIFGASLGAVTKPVEALVEALVTPEIAQKVIAFVTPEQILDAKMFVMPFIPLLTPVSPDYAGDEG